MVYGNSYYYSYIEFRRRRYVPTTKLYEFTTQSLPTGFWRDDKIRQISAPLTAQISVYVKQNFVNGKDLLQDCFSALSENVIDDTLLKNINLNILMHTRSEDVRVRILALSSSEALWRIHGGKLIGTCHRNT